MKTWEKKSVLSSLIAVFVFFHAAMTPAIIMAAEGQGDSPGQKMQGTSLQQDEQTDLGDFSVIHTPPEKALSNQPLLLSIQADQATQVTVFYRMTPHLDVQKMSMHPDADGNYVAEIPAEHMIGEFLEYWFEVTYENKKITLPEDIHSPFTVNIEAATENPKDDQPQPILHEPKEIISVEQHEPVMFDVEAPNAQSVTFHYQTGEKMVPLHRTMIKNQDVFSVQIPAEEFWSPSFFYRMKVVMENGEVVTLPISGEWYPSEVTGLEEPDFQQLPPLLITELVPDTTNIGSKDGYEFIEIYNNTNQPIHMKDYRLLYRYPDGKPDLIWDLTEDKVIPAQESFIVWIHNSENKGTTLDQFNEEFRLQLTSDKVTIIEADGMANSGERTLVIATDLGQEISSATYNKGGGKNNVVANHGITYQYPLTGNEMKMVGLSETITPTEIINGQSPIQPVVIVDDKQPPTIQHRPAEEGNGEIDFSISANIKDENGIKAAYVYYKMAEEKEFKSLPMMKEAEHDMYTATISANELWGKEIIYFIEATDGIHTVKTDEFKVNIIQPDVDFQQIPEILITEIVPDSTNVRNLDGYEFVEIYNNTNQPLNLRDYKIRYRYPMEGREADLLWGYEGDQDLYLGSGKTMVFWVINGANPHLTVEDFNRHYGVNLVEGESIVKMYNGGMANGSTRALVMATNTGHELSMAYYNEEVNVKDPAPNKGIFYRYPEDGGKQMVKISSAQDDATPGQVEIRQIPKEKVLLTGEEIPPTIENLTEIHHANAQEKIAIKADIQDNLRVKTATLYYRTSENEPYKAVNLEENYDTLLYESFIYYPEIIGKEKIEYYFVARDGENETQSEMYTITLEQDEHREGLRLNVANNEIISGKKVIKATSETSPDEIKLFIDGVEKTATYKALEKEAYFAFDVRKTNLYFKNGVTMGEDILRIFDDTINTYTTITIPIEAERLFLEKENIITIRSGTKVSPFDETSVENRDDFYIKNIRLVLSDGSVIYDPKYADKEKELPVGDGGSSKEYYDFSFTIPVEKFSSLAFEWDTNETEEGPHEIEAKDGQGSEASSIVIVDHSAPTITPTIEDGKEYKGTFTLDAEITDTYSKITSSLFKLDGKEISTPYETSSAKLAAGEHTFSIFAVDEAGNEAEKTVSFHVVDEHPEKPEPIQRETGATNATLSVKAADPTGDQLAVSFYQAYQYTASDREHVKIYHHVSDTEPPRAFRPDGEMEIKDSDREKLVDQNGDGVETTSSDQFPYHRFDVQLNDAVIAEDEIEIIWNGSSFEGRKVTMYAWNFETGKWEALTSAVAGTEPFTLRGTVIAGPYMKNQQISVIVQDQILQDQDFDFTFVWMSDTQYYSASYPHIYEKQVNWIAENKDALNIEYVFHTGDLVDDAQSPAQWDVADRSMKVLDDAGIRYGVLAGNHDVGHKDGSYDQYYQFFGEKRFDNRSYYGGSYKNNRGHYDLISSNGNDFLMVYMGWGISDEDIKWMNEVISNYPDRKVILAFHEYLLVSGNRSPIGEKLYQEVVLPNSNVIAVLSGHYHDAQTLRSEIDDSGDGIPDRTVYQMLADYQGGPEGGQGFLRLLQFNIETNEVAVKTYSPYLDKYNYYDPATYPDKDAFIWPLQLEPKEKKVETDSFKIHVYTEELIGEVEEVQSGDMATVLWEGLEPNETYYWYTVVSDPFGGKTRSDIWSITTKEEDDVNPENPSDPEVPEDPDPDNPSDPETPKEPDPDNSSDSETPKSPVPQDPKDQAPGNPTNPTPGDQTDSSQEGREPGQTEEDGKKLKDDDSAENWQNNAESKDLPHTATHDYALFFAGIVVLTVATVFFIAFYRKRYS